MSAELADEFWWKNAVFYCLDVETFQDSNGDGIGDFAGLTSRLQYLAELGITCVWLMPFYPTPNHDDGYDIIDYYAVDPRLGTLGQFVEFVRAAHQVGIRVIADLVINHTSREHPWFQAARADRNSPYRQWYVWSDTIPDEPKDIVFPGAETSNWEWDEVAGQYFLHRFYNHQPDLNVRHPALTAEIGRIISFWLQLGLDGFRVDAVPFIVETAGAPLPEDFEPHGWIRDLRSMVTRRRGDAVLLGEVNLSFEETRSYFGNDAGDELHMCLNFNLNQALALGLVRKDASSLITSLKALPSLPAQSAWGNFIRNHDEWSLDKLTAAERQEIFEAFGPRKDMQIFGRGLRRRLPSMLGGDQRRIAMAYGLLYSLPGAPILLYGEEIGMAENLAIPGRLSVRAPMQWSGERNAGFSGARSEQLVRPMVRRGDLSFRNINVEAQRGSEASLLKWIGMLTRARRGTPEIGLVTPVIIDHSHASILALAFECADRCLLALVNFGDDAQSVGVELDKPISRIEQIIGSGSIDQKDRAVDVEIEGLATRWIRLIYRG